MIRAPLRVLALLFPLALLSSPAEAGIEIQTETRRLQGEDKRVRRASAFFDRRDMRLDTKEGRRGIIYRGERGLVWVVDRKKGTYLEFDKPSPEALAAQARARIDALPPGERAAADAAVSAGPDAVLSSLRIEETGKRDRILDIPCRELDVAAAGQRIARVCMASYGDAGVDPGSFAVVNEVKALLEDSVAVLAAGDVGADELTALETFAQLDGVPLRVLAYRDGQPRAETVVTGLAQKDLAAGVFELPDGARPKFRITIRE